jgi:hypothetical protein
VVFGNIETPGAHDVYTFTAKAGDCFELPDRDATWVGSHQRDRADGRRPARPRLPRGTDFKVPESGSATSW